VPFARGGRREIAVRHEGIVKVPDEVEAAIANVVHGADPTRKACALGTWVGRRTTAFCTCTVRP
jgi:hypothetical protein